MLVVSPRAHRRHPSALRHVAKVAARVSYLQSTAAQTQTLDGDSILLPCGQILTAPPESFESPSTGTPAALELTDAISLSDQIAAIDAHESLQNNIEADDLERADLRAQIEKWRELEMNADCGFPVDFSEEIERTQARIEFLDERLSAHDISAEIAAVPETAAPPLSPYQRAGAANAKSEAARLALPFWRYHDAQLAQTLDYERTCKRHRVEGSGERRINQYQREVPCTQQQVDYIEFLAGSAEAGRALVQRDLSSLRVSEASSLISWLKNGRPNA